MVLLLKSIVPRAVFAAGTGNSNLDSFVNSMVGSNSSFMKSLAPIVKAVNLVFWLFMAILAVTAVYQMANAAIAYGKVDRSDTRAVKEYKDIIKNWGMALIAVACAPLILVLVKALNIL